MLVLLTVVFLLASTLALIAVDRRPGSTRSALRVPSRPEAVARLRRIRADAGRELASAYGHLARQADVIRRRLRSTSEPADVDAPLP